MAQATAVRSVGRGLRILGAFTPEQPELSVGQIARVLDVHMSTASRLASTLEAEGFLNRAPDGAFRLGPEVVRLGLLAVAGEALSEAARPSMDGLAADTGETVVLSVGNGTETVDVAQVGSSYLVGGTSWVGRRLPLHSTSDGKVLMAFGAAELASGTLAALTPETITDRRALQRSLGEIRAAGWASALGECEEGLNGVAAPIFAGSGSCVAALSVSGPSYRVTVERVPELARRCVEAAHDISVRLGWEGGRP